LVVAPADWWRVRTSLLNVVDKVQATDSRTLVLRWQALANQTNRERSDLVKCSDWVCATVSKCASYYHWGAELIMFLKNVGTVTAVCAK
jgi:hypothetical protein